MKSFVVLVGILVFNQASASGIWGWLSDAHNTDDVIDATGDPTAECRQYARWGHCAFYDCIEARFPCGPEGYTQKISKHFCNKIDANYHRFDAFGHRWLNETSICLQSFMLPIYEQSSSSCAQIKEAGLDSIVNCNEREIDGRDFCSFMSSNGDAYNSLMGREEIMLMLSLRDSRVVSSMVTQAASCGASSISETLTSVRASIGNFAGSVYNRISGWFS